WSATRLAGGTLRYTANASINSNMNAVNGTFTGYALESGTIVATDTGTGAGTMTGTFYKTTPGTVNFVGKVTLVAADVVNLTEGVLAFEPGNLPASGAGTITLGNSNTLGVFRMVGAGSATSSRPFSADMGAIDIADAGGTLTLTGSL